MPFGHVPVAEFPVEGVEHEAAGSLQVRLCGGAQGVRGVRGVGHRYLLFAVVHGSRFRQIKCGECRVVRRGAALRCAGGCGPVASRACGRGWSRGISIAKERIGEGGPAVPAQ